MSERRTPKAASTPVCGLVAEGESGLVTACVLLRRANIQVVRPTKFRSQPAEGPLDLFVEKLLLPHVFAACRMSVPRVLVVFDREHRRQCPGALASSVAALLDALLRERYGYTGSPPVSVVCADRKTENWLIADPDGIRTCKLTQHPIAGLVGATADGKDAEAILRRAYGRGHSYDKTRDAGRLAASVRVLDPNVRRRSKSLDKLLRDAGVEPASSIR